jgi:tetratricopeptide (TPR) repeat protein
MAEQKIARHVKQVGSSQEGSIDKMADKEDEARKKQAAFWLEYSQQLSTAIRYTEALAAAERSVALDETSAPAWYVKGTCLAMVAQYEAAATDFEHALVLDPSYVPAWDGKAWVLGILGRKDEALAAINRALELDPEYFEAQKRKKRIEAM